MVGVVLQKGIGVQEYIVMSFTAMAFVLGPTPLPYIKYLQNIYS